MYEVAPNVVIYFYGRGSQMAGQPTVVYQRFAVLKDPSRLEWLPSG